MAIELDHVIVSSRDRVASARLLAHLLGVPWEETAFGVFSPVYVNDGLTLDFIQVDAQTDTPFPVEHFCFRVNDAEFDGILGRIEAAGIAWRSKVRGGERPQGRYRLRRARGLLERAGRAPVGNADSQLCA